MKLSTVEEKQPAGKSFKSLEGGKVISTSESVESGSHHHQRAGIRFLRTITPDWAAGRHLGNLDVPMRLKAFWVRPTGVRSPTTATKFFRCAKTNIHIYIQTEDKRNNI